jgi:hypothetical protein
MTMTKATGGGTATLEKPRKGGHPAKSEAAGATGATTKRTIKAKPGVATSGLQRAANATKDIPMGGTGARTAAAAMPAKATRATAKSQMQAGTPQSTGKATAGKKAATKQKKNG